MEEIAYVETSNQFFAKILRVVMKTSSISWSPRITTMTDVKTLHKTVLKQQK